MAAPAVTLKAPRAAAIAGILFSLLRIASVLPVRPSVPADPREAGAWLATSAPNAALTMHLVPLSVEWMLLSFPLWLQPSARTADPAPDRPSTMLPIHRGCSALRTKRLPARASSRRGREAGPQVGAASSARSR